MFRFNGAGPGLQDLLEAEYTAAERLVSRLGNSLGYCVTLRPLAMEALEKRVNKPASAV